MHLQLYNLHTNAVIYSYDMDKQTIEIKDATLKKDLENQGITIPENASGNLHGRIVRLGDADLRMSEFHRAFYKYYQPIKNTNEFQWKTED